MRPPLGQHLIGPFNQFEPQYTRIALLAALDALWHAELHDFSSLFALLSGCWAVPLFPSQLQRWQVRLWYLCSVACEGCVHPAIAMMIGSVVTM